jgi:uncharacterized coiled-coil protein SlyX
MIGSLFKPTQDNDKSINSELDTANFRITQLEKKLSDLTFTLDTLWELLTEQNGFDATALEEKLNAKKDELESRANETTACSSCSRTVPANKSSCYYCGAKLT